jgi:hypothetical protein
MAASGALAACAGVYCSTALPAPSSASRCVYCFCATSLSLSRTSSHGRQSTSRPLATSDERTEHAPPLVHLGLHVHVARRRVDEVAAARRAVELAQAVGKLRVSHQSSAREHLIASKRGRTRAGPRPSRTAWACRAPSPPAGRPGPIRARRQTTTVTGTVTVTVASPPSPARDAPGSGPRRARGTWSSDCACTASSWTRRAPCGSLGCP